MKFRNILLCSLIAWIGSCKKPDMVVVPPPGTVAVSTISNYLNNNFDFSLFAAAVERAGWSDTLGRQENSYTVFAIDNRGFNGMGIFEPADFGKWTTDSLRTLIKAHLLPGRLLYNDIPRSLDTRFKNLGGNDLWISLFAKAQAAGITEFYVNGVNVIANQVINALPGVPPSYGISLLNGMVYPVTTAIKTTAQDIQAFLASRPDMSIFTTALKKFGGWDRLRNESPITVLAPPDSVFLRYGITADSIGRMDVARYKRVFMDCYIISLNRIFQSDIFVHLNRENVPLIPASYPPLLTLPTSEPNLILVMFANYGFFYGSFVFDMAQLQDLPNEYGGGFWQYKILGTEGTSYPRIGDPATGYTVPYIGESKRSNSGGRLRGAYTNYTLSNGVVHLVSGLLVTPQDAQR